LIGAALASLLTAATGRAQLSPTRTFQVDDLFELEQIVRAVWSPDAQRAAIEIRRPSNTLSAEVPCNEIRVLDAGSQKLRVLAARMPGIVGFFNAAWSPDGKRLAFLSVDANASVHLWQWPVASRTPLQIRDVDVRTGTQDLPFVWLDADRLAVVAWDHDAARSSPLHANLLRGKGVADGWQRAMAGREPTATVFESGRRSAPEPPRTRLVAIDLRSNARQTIARGGIHQLRASADGRFVSFRREEPGLPGQAVASYFAQAIGVDEDQLYDAVNWGTATRVVNTQTGAEVAPESFVPAPRPALPAGATQIQPPRDGARRLAVAPDASAALFVTDGPEGSVLSLCRASEPCAELWRGNQWVRQVRTGRTEAIAYTASDGTPLTAWLLLPPDYVAGARVPTVVVVYPGTVYTATQPASFSVFQSHFEHPQLFAARGYAVLLPSMPAPKNPSDATRLDLLPNGVLPAVDAGVARGVVDPDRVAVIGQSAGGFATQGLITQTARFRSAISSAGYSDFVSLYGTFYGQYRYGDANIPESGAVLRMLMAERGYWSFGGPPWEQLSRYQASSALLSANRVTTPIMLVHGDLDFVPIQQDEEFFTALYRQDKRVRFVRYQGEMHTIVNRPNVLDLWRRIDDWLNETMAPR